MAELSRGANAPLASSSVELSVSGAAQGSVDLMLFQLTAGRQVRSDADFVFFNQPVSPEGAVRMIGPAGITADLASVPADIEHLVVAVSLDDAVSGSLADIPGLSVTLAHGSDPIVATASGMTTERAAVLVEIYRRGADWKVRNVSAGWTAGLPALVAEHGVSIDDAPAAPPTAAPPTAAPPTAAPLATVYAPPTGLPVAVPPPTAAAPPPASAAAPAAAAASQDVPPAAGKVDLGKRTGAINLTKGQRVAIDSSELIVASITWPPATDYDVFALIRYRDGRTEAVAAFGTAQQPKFSLVSSDGAVRHAGDVGRASGGPRLSRKERKAAAQQAVGQLAEEKIEIRPHAGIRAIVPVAYSAQSNGTGSFRRYQVSMSIDNGRGTTVRIDAANADDNDQIYSCVPGIIIIGDDGVVIDSLEQYSAPTSERRPVIGDDLQVQMDAGDTNLFK